MIGATSGRSSLNPKRARGSPSKPLEIETRQIQSPPGEPPFGVDHLESAGCFSTASCSRRQRTCCQLAIGSPFIFRIVSPRVRPLAAATVPASGAPTTGLRLLHPAHEKRPVEHDGEQKIRHRPAATIAMRRQTLWRLKARCASSGANRAFALVEHLQRSRRAAARRSPTRSGPGPGESATRPPETDRETQDLHPEKAARSRSGRTRGTTISTAKRDDESQDGDGEIHAAWLSVA